MMEGRGGLARSAGGGRPAPTWERRAWVVQPQNRGVGKRMGVDRWGPATMSGRGRNWIQIQNLNGFKLNLNSFKH
jgi:hypothetical protein